MDVWPFSSSEDDELVDPDLKDIQPGWVLEHVEGTLEVNEEVDVTYDRYFETTEWRLETTGGENYFLEREFDDGVFWSLYREGNLDRAPNLRENIDSNSTPPRSIQYDGKEYTRNEYGDAVRDGSQGRESYLWADYQASDGEYLALEVYETSAVELWIGEEVNEYEFDILPE